MDEPRVKLQRDSKKSTLFTVYQVYVNDVHIGECWHVPGRSFSGGWRGSVNYGEVVTFVNWRHTRKEVVERMIQAMGETND